MGLKELRAIYGANRKGPAVVNRAVCAEIPGAPRLYKLKNELLAAKVGNPALEPYYRAVLETVAEMRSSIAAKYGLTSREAKSNEETGNLSE